MNNLKDVQKAEDYDITGAPKEVLDVLLGTDEPSKQVDKEKSADKGNEKSGDSEQGKSSEPKGGDVRVVPPGEQGSANGETVDTQQTDDQKKDDQTKTEQKKDEKKKDLGKQEDSGDYGIEDAAGDVKDVFTDILFPSPRDGQENKKTNDKEMDKSDKQNKDGSNQSNEQTKTNGSNPDESETTGKTKTFSDELKLAFQTFDKDNSGKIDENELRDLLKGIDVDQSDLDAIFKEADTDGDKQLSIDELVKMLVDDFGIDI